MNTFLLKYNRDISKEIVFLKVEIYFLHRRQPVCNHLETRLGNVTIVHLK